MATLSRIDADILNQISSAAYATLPNACATEALAPVHMPPFAGPTTTTPRGGPYEPSYADTTALSSRHLFGNQDTCQLVGVFCHKLIVRPLKTLLNILQRLFLATQSKVPSSFSLFTRAKH